jgi:predicted nucleic acid-binding protein
MAWLIDTNVVSELGKRRPDAAVLAWASTVEDLTSYLSAITVFELERGVHRTERIDATQGPTRRLWLDTVVGVEYAGRILSIDAEVAAIAARLHVPDPRPLADAFIAATALHHNLTVVTRNVKDFAPLGVRVLDPWTIDSG